MLTALVFAKDGTFLEPGTSRDKGAPGFRWLRARVAGATHWLMDVARRQSVIAELSRLSDHELADIGLTRADLPRVFDPAFARSRAMARKAGC